MSLIASVKDNDLQALKALIVGGADVNAADGLGHTALWWAARRGRVESATALLDSKADADKADNHGYTPLHEASYNGRVECVRILIQHKADVNASTIHGSTPMHFASLFGHLTCVHVLARAGASRASDQPNNDDFTPLAYAIEWNHPNIVEYLLHLGAKMNNVKSDIIIPHWATDIIAKRCNVMNFTLALKGVLKRRFGISKDATHLIALYFWSERLK